jgi:primosomal protein N' (replication factor Y)
MLSKGLDFEKVSLVGIINADQLLHFTDFRASKGAFQLITQVGGRAGRKNKHLKQLKKFTFEQISKLLSDKNFRSVIIFADVDAG